MSLEKFQVKTKISKNVSCKNCVFLNKEKLNGHKYCMDLGIVETSPICSAYRPNVYALRSSNGSEEVIDLFKAIRNLPDEFLPIIASLLARESKTRKYTKYKLLQPVVILIDGKGDYLSDYCRAYILDADKEFVRAINKTGTLIAQFPIDSTSIYTLKDFRAVKEKLTATGKIKNPKIEEERKAKLKILEDSAVPTIDNAVKEGKIKKNLMKSDLYTLFKELNS